MELTKVKIAKLVLGYLKSEKYNRTSNLFLEESEELKEFKGIIEAGKYFGTRLMGMSLIDILEEYVSIYSLVQGPLEASSFYDENRQKTSTPRLLEQIKYLLEAKNFGNSSPIMASEVDATPVHELPGIRHADTPKLKKPRTKTSSKSGDSNDAFDVSEVFAQTLLENHELHEKIAETINNVRNTPEVPKPSVQSREEKIGVGASQELEHVIKTVVERIEEQPICDMILEELMECYAAGTIPTETPQQKSSYNDFSGSQIDRTKSKVDKRTSIEDYNDDAVRSIIKVSQQPPPPPVTQPASSGDSVKPSEVIVYDGSLESYLKTAGGGTAVVPSNPVFVSNGRYFVMPQPQPVTTTIEDPSTIYLVNNQPVLSVAPVAKTITDNDIMTMPTIIVNDDLMSRPTSPPPAERKLMRIAPKMSTAAEEAREFIKLPGDPSTTSTTSMDRKRRPFAAKSAPTAPSTSRPQTPPPTVTLPKNSTPRQASHVRNLDFSSPLKMNQVKLSQSIANKLSQPAKVQTEQKAKPAAKRTWDEDLRQGIVVDLPKTPPKKKPKRRGACNTRSSKAKKLQVEEEEKEKESPPAEPEAPPSPKEQPKTLNDSTLEQAMELEKNLETSPVLRGDQKTPLKDTMPKTPGGDVLFENNSLIMKNNCTPFTQVLDEHLKDVDLMALPTPSLPITPGFALINMTPNTEGTAYVSRSTDYSTTSSYYQPSDTEHNKSVEQLVEEYKTNETRQATKETVQIISNIVITSNSEINDQPMQNKVHTVANTEIRSTVSNEPGTNQNCEILKKFNSNVIGKKNLNLLKSENEVSSSSSSSSSSDSESEKSDEQSNKTVIHKRIKSEDNIRDILKHGDYTTAVITDKKPIIPDLEEVRKRTVRKIQSDQSLVKKPRKPPVKKAPRKAAFPKKKVEKEVVQKTDEEARKLVDGLKERGIHLVHNKTPKEIDVTEDTEELLSFTCDEEVEKREPNNSKTTQEICSNIVLSTDVAVPQEPQIEKGNNDEHNEFPVFDRVTYETVLEVKHVAQGRRKSIAEYDFALLNKSINAEVYSEDLNMELTRRIHSTCHFTLLDLPAKEKVNMLIPRRTKRSSMDKICTTPKADEDDLMDSVVTGVLNSPDGKNKRKRRTSGEDKQAKKTRQYENSRKLLSNIDVDDFLNKLHGGN